MSKKNNVSKNKNASEKISNQTPPENVQEEEFEEESEENTAAPDDRVYDPEVDGPAVVDADGNEVTLEDPIILFPKDNHRVEAMAYGLEIHRNNSEKESTQAGEFHKVDQEIKPSQKKIESNIGNKLIENIDRASYYVFEQRNLSQRKYQNGIVAFKFTSYPSAQKYYDENKLSLPDWNILTGEQLLRDFHYQVVNFREYFKSAGHVGGEQQ